jgi:hypothetical protein
MASRTRLQGTSVTTREKVLEPCLGNKECFDTATCIDKAAEPSSERDNWRKRYLRKEAEWRENMCRKTAS